MSDNVSDDKPISYVFAHHRAEISTGTADPPVLIVLSPTKRGWGSRSTSRHYFNHDYVCYETFEQVYEWLKLECARPFVTHIAKRLWELLSAPSPSSGGFLRTGCFECNPMMGEVERAEKSAPTSRALEKRCTVRPTSSIRKGGSVSPRTQNGRAKARQRGTNCLVRPPARGCRPRHVSGCVLG